MKATKLKKTNKSTFEHILFTLNNSKTLEYDVHHEHSDKEGEYIKLHLYYNENGHIGTWQKGGLCWYFQDSLPKKKMYGVAND